VTKQESRTPERETAQDRAADWLEKYPTEHGPTDSKIVKAAGGRAGHAEATIKRVLARVGVVITTIPGTKNESRWSLTDPTDPTELTELIELIDPTSGKSAQSAQLAHGSETGRVEPTPDPTPETEPAEPLPESLPCPAPGCEYRAELMGQLTSRPYYRCVRNALVAEVKS
jgi:hypothetical protein